MIVFCSIPWLIFLINYWNRHIDIILLDKKVDQPRMVTHYSSRIINDNFQIYENV